MTDQSTPKMTLDERILRLESRLQPKLPGTQIMRVMKPERGFQWCVGVGLMNEVKLFFYGETIEEAVSKAEEDVFKAYPLPDDMKTSSGKAHKEPVWLFPGILATIES